MALKIVICDLFCHLLCAPAPRVGWWEPFLHTPKAVTYHEQSHYCRFMIGHSLGRMESRVNKFKIHFDNFMHFAQVFVSFNRIWTKLSYDGTSITLNQNGLQAPSGFRCLLLSIARNFLFLWCRGPNVSNQDTDMFTTFHLRF